MGFGICAAFGLGLVPGARYPTAIIGDGSFLMQPQAIRDMVKHLSNCTIVVLDNQAMGVITALQWAQQYDGFATADPALTGPVDYAILARSMGCQAYTPCASIDSLTDALDQAFRHEGPAVVASREHLGRQAAARIGGSPLYARCYPLSGGAASGQDRRDRSGRHRLRTDGRREISMSASAGLRDSLAQRTKVLPGVDAAVMAVAPVDLDRVVSNPLNGCRMDVIRDSRR